MENNNNIYNNNNFNGNYYNMPQGGIYVQQPMVQQQQPKNNIKYFDELFRKKSDGILQRGPFWKIHLTYLFIRIAIFLPLLLINKNAVAILMPYVRSQLSLITAQPGMECIVMPPINVSAMMEKSSIES